MKSLILIALIALSGCAGIEPLQPTPPRNPVVVVPGTVPGTTPIPIGRPTTPPIGCTAGQVRGVEC